jgi:hypothetical protein
VKCWKFYSSKWSPIAHRGSYTQTKISQKRQRESLYKRKSLYIDKWNNPLTVYNNQLLRRQYQDHDLRLAAGKLARPPTQKQTRCDSTQL